MLKPSTKLHKHVKSGNIFSKQNRTRVMSAIHVKIFLGVSAPLRLGVEI